MASVHKDIRNGVHTGKWIVRYFAGIGPAGKRKHKQARFDREKEVKKFKAEIEAKEAKGRPAEDVGRSVREVCEEFLREQENRKSDGRIRQGVIKRAKQDVDLAIIPRLGALPIGDVRLAHVDDLYRWMIREAGLKPHTAKVRLQGFRRVCVFAQRRGYITDEHVSLALKDLRKIGAGVVRTFTKEQAGALLRAADQRVGQTAPRTHEMVRCMVHLAMFCGLRFGEIGGLKVENIDVAAGLIRVRHNLAERDELKAPKTKAGVRSVPLPPHLGSMLTAWLARHYVENDRDLVFRSLTGSALSPGNFHMKDWKPLLKRAGLENKDDPFHFHALRHFAASWMITAGVPIMNVAKLMGHSKFDTTLQHYAHPVVEVVEGELGKRLAAGLIPASPVPEITVAAA